MTERQYLMDIKRKCSALGVWKDEFERAQRRLARIYVRIDEAEAMYARSGAAPLIKHTNKAGASNPTRNPLLVEIDTLYDMAMTHERELGLTAAALKRIQGGGAAKQAEDDSPLAALGKLVDMQQKRAALSKNA